MMLKDQNEFYKACFNSMQVGILVYNSTKEILISNNPLLHVFGYLNNELQSKKVNTLFKNTSFIDDFINNSEAKKFNSAVEIIGLQKSGLEIPVEIVFGRIEYNSQTYYKLLISDISLRKKKETKILNLTSRLEDEIKLRNQELEKAIDQLKSSFKNENELNILKDKLAEIENQLKDNNLIDNGVSNRLIINSSQNLKIDKILLNKTVYKYKKGETIYCKGNLSNHIFLIKKGDVKTYKINDQGKEFITGFYTNNQYFGYSSFVKHKSHFENSKAIGNVKLYKINKNEISTIINNNSKILYEFIDLLASDLIQVKEQLLLLAYASVRKKTARTLLKMVENTPSKFREEIEISRSDLANTVGVANETLIRTLQDFKKEKLISDNKKKIRIIDKDKLLKIQ